MSDRPSESESAYLQELADTYYPIAKRIARKWENKSRMRSLPSLDLEGEATLEMMRCIMKQMEAPRAPEHFKRYILCRLKGHMIDVVRRNTLIPRTVYSEYLRYQEIPEDERERLSEGTLAKRLGISNDMAKKILAYKNLTTISYEQWCVDGDSDLLNSQYIGKAYNACMTRDTLRFLKEKLSHRHYSILEQHFLEGKGATTLARELGCTVENVTQTIRRALKAARICLTEDENLAGV